MCDSVSNVFFFFEIMGSGNRAIACGSFLDAFREFLCRRKYFVFFFYQIQTI